MASSIQQTLKIFIMLGSVLGTLCGWLALLLIETQATAPTLTPVQVPINIDNSATVQPTVPIQAYTNEGVEVNQAVSPVDVSQLRQVTTPQTVNVVATTRSSR